MPKRCLDDLEVKNLEKTFFNILLFQKLSLVLKRVDLLETKPLSDSTSRKHYKNALQRFMSLLGHLTTIDGAAASAAALASAIMMMK